MSVVVSGDFCCLYRFLGLVGYRFVNFQDLWNKFSLIFGQLCDKKNCALVIMRIGKKVVWVGGRMGRGHWADCVHFVGSYENEDLRLPPLRRRKPITKTKTSVSVSSSSSLRGLCKFWASSSFLKLIA